MNTLFKKGHRNHKKLVISSPVRADSSTSPGSSPQASPSSAHVILKTKYEFVGQAPPELTVKKHSFLTLLDRPGNGWLQVKSMDGKQVGIVPASYVTIVVNDSATAITTEWLNDFAESSLQEKISAVSVVNVLKSPLNEVWYQLKATTESQSKIYSVKFYGDFVNLHQQMLREFGTFKAPYLPRIWSDDHEQSEKSGKDKKNGKTHSQEVAMMANLDRYMNSMLQFSHTHPNELFQKFLTAQVTRKIEFCADDIVPNDAAVVQALYPGSSVLRVDKAAKDRCYSTTAPLPPMAKYPQSPTLTDISGYSDSNVKYSSYLNQSHSEIHDLSHSSMSTFQGKGHRDSRDSHNSKNSGTRNILKEKSDNRAIHKGFDAKTGTSSDSEKSPEISKTYKYTPKETPSHRYSPLDPRNSKDSAKFTSKFTPKFNPKDTRDSKDTPKAPQLKDTFAANPYNRASANFSMNSFLDSYDTSGSEADSPQKSILSGKSVERQFFSTPHLNSYYVGDSKTHKVAGSSPKTIEPLEPIGAKKALFRSWTESPKEIA